MHDLPIHLDILRAFWLFFSGVGIILGLYQQSYILIVFAIVVFVGSILLKKRPTVGRIVLLLHFALQILMTPKISLLLV